MINYVKIALVIATGCWLSVQQSLGQDSPQTPYFPYQTGDFWVYKEYDPVKQEVINEIKYRVYTDSTDNRGMRWVHIETDDNSSIDSVYYKVHENGDIYFNEYFDVELKGLNYEETNFDERWVGGFIEEDDKGEEYYAVFTLRTIDEIPFFGEIREQRSISLTVTPDTTCPNCGLDPSEDIWVEDFGVMGRGGYEGGSYWRMKGAWKNEEVYGDTTFNEITVDTLRSDFFPYETGDFWVYTIIRNFADENNEKVKYRVYADSMDTDSTKWVHVEKNVNGQMDSVYYKVTKDGDIYSDDLVGEEVLKFKYEEVSKHDYWVGGELENGNYGVYELRTLGSYDVPSTPQSVSESRSIYFYEMPDTTCCNSRIFRERWVAGFGIVGVSYFGDLNVEAWSFAGIYKDGEVYGDTTFTVITSNELPTSVPESFKLHQNYPNPFNPSTTVEYEVSRSVKSLSATLYTYTGQKIAELFSEKYHSPGTYRLTIDEQILEITASSMIILTLKSNTEVQHLKMIYLK